jgi:hypothetical protein
METPVKLSENYKIPDSFEDAGFTPNRIILSQKTPR